MSRITLLTMAWLVVPRLLGAQTADACADGAQTFGAWMNCRVNRVVAATVGPGGEEKQAEPPSVAEDSTTLVDSTSASDFVGVGMTFLGLRQTSGETDSVSTPTTITATAYALLAGAHGRDPLADADFYHQHGNWRRVSFTLGRQAAKDDAAGVNAAATVVGAKVVLLNLREITRQDNLTQLQGAIDTANVGFADLVDRVQRLMLTNLEPTLDHPTFVIKSLSDPEFQKVLERIDEPLGKQIDSTIAAHVQAQVQLRDAILTTIEEVKQKPQFSVAWTAGLRDETGPNQHRIEAILDYGMAPRFALSVNAGIDVIDAKDLVLPSTTKTNVGRIAGAARLALARAERLGLKDAQELSVAAEVRWEDPESIYKVQCKIDFPVSAGVSVPVSVTWASRTDLIDESDVRGAFGFTIDTSKLAAALR